ncbi:hypothetical protein [Marinobacter sp. JSM 1782161]|uniref:hypothetical protein n=1 Tax=Marinobacter sp. JSM 1782161 TaxID=2685906 RepID=UPI001403C43B|nr:hypothetical protein [Marinobacter sp. JSM 1782161]
MGTESTESPIAFELDADMASRLTASLTLVAPAFRHQARRWHRMSRDLDRLLANTQASSPRDLCTALGNRIAIQRPVVERQSTWWGRCINRLTADHIDRIELVGRELLTVMVLLGYPPDPAIDPVKPYLLDLDVAEALHDALQRWLEGRRDIH